MNTDYDVCVIGGGVNGTGIARDAVGRGFSVLLVEARDLASATSSASTKLIHGGLRYLEQYEFKLVREALEEREALLRSAPHIIRPMEFVLPHKPGLRPSWMIRAGLFLYDHIGGREILPPSKYLNFSKTSLADPLGKTFKKGFSYSDCWVDDSRLVVLNAMDAREKGADIKTYTACIMMEPAADRQYWRVTLRDMLAGDEFDISARMIVNASGPWVRGFLEASHLADNSKAVPHVRLVKGSHIVLPKLYDGPQAYTLQQPDGRVVFAIPYEGEFTLVGTTDVEFTGDPSSAAIEAKEIEYLCRAVNDAFIKQVKAEDIIWSYSGVRPLADDGEKDASDVSRDYRLHTDRRFGPAVLSVFGGKITTYRKLAEQATDILCEGLTDKMAGPWTGGALLPGGDILGGSLERFIQLQQEVYPDLPGELVERYARAYGTRMEVFLKKGFKIKDLETHFGDDIYEAEIVYLLKNEFAKTVEDILWRRSKLGLHITDKTIKKLEQVVPGLLKGVREK